MAKVKYGSIVTDMRNKLGGTVYSRNRYGSYSKNYAIPTLVQNAWTAPQRSSMASCFSGWQALNDDQRGNWNRATADYPRTDSQGNVYFMSGQNLYCSINRNLVLVGSAVISNPPTKVLPSDPTDVKITKWDPLTPRATINVSNPVVDANATMVIKCSKGLSPGIQVVSTALRFVTIAGNFNGTFDIDTPYNTKFSAQPDGTRLFVEIYLVQNISGSAGMRLQANSLPV